jgi:hypothetical protein
MSKCEFPILHTATCKPTYHTPTCPGEDAAERKAHSQVQIDSGSDEGSDYVLI